MQNDIFATNATTNLQTLPPSEIHNSTTNYTLMQLCSRNVFALSYYKKKRDKHHLSPYTMFALT